MLTCVIKQKRIHITHTNNVINSIFKIVCIEKNKYVIINIKKILIYLRYVTYQIYNNTYMNINAKIL